MKKTPVITPPDISEETLKQMAIFFMKTSIPRILAAEREAEKSNGY